MPNPSRDTKLTGGLPFGCLFAVLLGLGMAVVIVMGSTLGDCPSGYDCPDPRMGRSFALAFPIIIGGAALIWLVTSLLRSHLQQHLRARTLRAILVGLTIAAVWFGFRPAFELFFWLDGHF